MNKIDEKELFHHVSTFFKNKGIELQEGPYTQGIKKGCELLADTVNLSQQAFEMARDQMERQVEHMRHVIHERTAPRTSRPSAAGASANKGRAKSAKSGSRTSSRSKPKGSKRSR